MASTEAQKKASAKYDKENTVQIALRLNKNTDSDILEYFAALKRQGGSRQGFIKQAIRKSIEGINSASIWFSDKALRLAIMFDDDLIRKHVGEEFYGLSISFDPVMNEIHVVTNTYESVRKCKYNREAMKWEFDDKQEYILAA